MLVKVVGFLQKFLKALETMVDRAMLGLDTDPDLVSDTDPDLLSEKPFL